MLLKLRHDGPLSSFAFSFNLRRYNTEYRTDHSTRNAHLTPFQVLDNCEV